MLVSYWQRYPTRYMLIAPFNGDMEACIAPYTPIKLIREYTP